MHLELHMNLVKDDSLKCLSSESIWSHAKRQGSFCRMPDEDFYLFHVEHMKNHYLTGGCGIRFFIDLWILNHLLKYDVEKRMDALKKCGLLQFERVAIHLSEVWFGGAVHTKLTRSMETYILSAGVYGTVQNWALVQEVQNEGKLKSVIRRLWLPYEDLCWSYPALTGRRWLQPWYEWRRFTKMVAEGRWKRSVTELKANRDVSKGQKEKMKQMLKELGL